METFSNIQQKPETSNQQLSKYGKSEMAGQADRLEIKVTCHHSTSSEVPLPYLGVRKHDALSGLVYAPADLLQDSPLFTGRFCTVDATREAQVTIHRFAYILFIIHRGEYRATQGSADLTLVKISPGKAPFFHSTQDSGQTVSYGHCLAPPSPQSPGLNPGETA
ncbi:hypothetical protein MG293_000234 [Ovis ammon polii]|uniref:Uncharacterized protein n=1 Tax=Ovis ammon polii TaxID=230172 RepID=A0AAD4UNA8_OVIAM|nr:hypothetical protein MG293_000234 [Ovis ammon polii]